MLPCCSMPNHKYMTEGMKQRKPGFGQVNCADVLISINKCLVSLVEQNILYQLHCIVNFYHSIKENES